MAGEFFTTAPSGKPSREKTPTLGGVAVRMGHSATSCLYGVWQLSDTGLPGQGVGPFAVQVRPPLQLGLLPSFLHYLWSLLLGFPFPLPSLCSWSLFSPFHCNLFLRNHPFSQVTLALFSPTPRSAVGPPHQVFRATAQHVRLLQDIASSPASLDLRLQMQKIPGLFH